MRRRMNVRGFGLLLCGMIVAGALGCNGSGGGGKSQSGSTIGPVQTNNNPAPTTSATIPTLVKATFASVASNSKAMAGDTVTVTFSKEVLLTNAVDPAIEFVLPVNGDSFGANATMAVSSGAKTDVVITLGSNPNLRVSGTFNVAFVGSGDATGIDLPKVSTGHITNPVTQQSAASAFPIDLGGVLTEGWRPAAALQVPRGGHTATLLKDGRILIVGGLATGGVYTAESEIYDPIANTFTKTSDPSLGGTAVSLTSGRMGIGAPFTPAGGTTVNYLLPVVRTDHTATLLDDGTVLICGGYGYERFDPAVTTAPTPLQEDLSSAHIFDPKTNKFTLVASRLKFPRSIHYAVKLGNGQVLITGGMNEAVSVGTGAPQPLTLPIAEIYDPATKTFAFLNAAPGTPDMVVPRMNGVAAYDQTANGVVFAGGVALFLPQGATTPVLGLSPGAETYDETTKKFTAVTAGPPHNLRFQSLAVDGNGALVIAGGSGTVPAAVDIVMETGNSFAAVGSLATARARAASESMGDTIVVIAGGSKMSGQPNPELSSVEVFNTDSKKVQAAPSMQYPRNSFTLTRVGDRMIAIGGFNASPGQFVDSSDGTAVPLAEWYSRP